MNLHPLVAAAAQALAANRALPEPARAALEQGLRGLAERAELTWALESLAVLARRIDGLGDRALARALVDIALGSMPALSLQRAERAWQRAAVGVRPRLVLADVGAARGEAAWKLAGVAGLRRRA